MLVDYRKMDTFLHHLNPRVALLIVLGVIIASVVWTDPLILTLATVLMVLAGCSCHFPWKKIGWFLKLALVASILIIIIEGFTLDESLIKPRFRGIALFYLLPNYSGAFRLGGVLYGYASSLKIYMVVIAIGILGYTIDPADIIQLLSGIPFASKHFVFIFSTAWRFIPLIQTQLFNLMDAQKTRGMELDKGKITERIKKVVPIITPLLSNSLDISNQIALAMESRAFGSDKKNKFVKPSNVNAWTRVQMIMVLALIAVMIVGVYAASFGVM